MGFKKLKYDITPIALEYFRQRSFEMIFDVFNTMKQNDNHLIKDVLLIIGEEEFYDSLKYHNDLIYSSLLTKNYELFDSFFIWKYSVYHSREIDMDYFKEEFLSWKNSISNYLYPSHASELNMIYDHLLSNQENFKIEALKIKKIEIKKRYQELYDELLSILLMGEKDKFHQLMEKDLIKFDNNLFLFIEEIVNPLMYQIGQMWQLNQISVAKEHLSTSMIDEVVNEFVKSSFQKKENLIAITSTVGNELHNLGVKVVGKFLEKHGYNVKNLTSKISKQELVNAIFTIKPDLVVLSVTLFSNVGILQEIVKEIKSDFSLFSGKVIVGGQGLLNKNKNIIIKDADFYCKNMSDLEEFLNNL